MSAVEEFEEKLRELVREAHALGMRQGYEECARLADRHPSYDAESISEVIRRALRILDS